MVINKFVFNGEKRSICISIPFVSTYVLSLLYLRNKQELYSQQFK